MRLFTAAVAATLLSGTAAHAEQWRVVSERTDDAPRVLMFVDQDSVTKTGDSAKGWVMTVVEPSAVKPGGWNVSTIYREIDCKGSQSRQVQSKYYEFDKLIENDTTVGKWVAINEGSMVDGVAKVMCGQRGYHTDAIKDPAFFAFQVFKILPE